jgi:hypothetical protein
MLLPIPYLGKAECSCQGTSDVPLYQQRSGREDVSAKASHKVTSPLGLAMSSLRFGTQFPTFYHFCSSSRARFQGIDSKIRIHIYQISTKQRHRSSMNYDQHASELACRVNSIRALCLRHTSVLFDPSERHT